MGTCATIVLVGAGHAHLHVAAAAESLVRNGARVVLVEPSRFWYSGLATAMLGGACSAADDQIDPGALIAAHGGVYVRDRVEWVDVASRRVHLAGPETLDFDYLSFNVGSGVDVHAIPGMSDDETVWPVKPISNLWVLRKHLEECVAAGDAPDIAVIGGGSTGVEVAANIQALAERRRGGSRVRLLTAGPRLVMGLPPGAARRLEQSLTRRGVEVHTGVRVVAREPGVLVAENGARIGAERVVLATGLQADPLMKTLDLPTRGREGLRVTRQLRSIASDRVFAAGDCAAMEGFDLPKLGVFGVRQAVFLHGNLLASLSGGALADYRPQKRCLAILNTGDGRALSTWGGLWWHGRASLHLKETIDRRFLQRYRRASAAS